MVSVFHPDAPLATRLTQNNKREAKGAPPQPPSIRAFRRDNLCRGCGKTISDGCTNCATCAIDDATKNMLDAALIGRQTANSPEARLKRATSQRKNALAQHAWKPSDQPAWLTDKFLQTRYNLSLLQCLHPPSHVLFRSRAGTLGVYVRVTNPIRGTGERWQTLQAYLGICDK